MKNTLYRLTCLFLCAVMLMAMFPAVAAPAAAAENESVRYMAPDKNGILRDVDPGFVTGAPAVASDSVDYATKLGKPTNVHWDEDTPTLLWFTANEPLERPYTIFRINLYKDGKKVYTGKVYADTQNLYSYQFGILLDYDYSFGTGEYYATVAALSDTGKYATGDGAKSDTWKYTKPSSKYSRPTSVSWDWPTATWTSNYDDASFEVQFYYSSSKSGEPYQVASSINPGTSWEIFNDTVKAMGKGYYYFRVRTHSDNIEEKGHSAWTAMSKAHYCSTGKKLDAPTAKITTDAATGNIRVSWNKIPGAEKHRVYRAESKNGPYVFMKTCMKARTFTDTTTELGKTYYYKVRALDTNDPFYPNGKFSSYSNVVKREQDLPQPDVSISLNKNGDPVVSWETVEGAAKYYVYRATSKTGTYSHVKSAISARSYTDTSAKAGKTYYYKVKAVHKNTASNSAQSSAVSIKAK